MCKTYTHTHTVWWTYDVRYSAHTCCMLLCFRILTCTTGAHTHTHTHTHTHSHSHPAAYCCVYVSITTTHVHYRSSRRAVYMCVLTLGTHGLHTAVYMCPDTVLTTRNMCPHTMLTTRTTRNVPPTILTTRNVRPCYRSSTGNPRRRRGEETQ